MEITEITEIIEALKLCVIALQDHVQYGDGDDIESIAYEAATNALNKYKQLETNIESN